jgi:hypothetical protein
MAKILNRSYMTGRFDLSDIDVHNGIEHDASLVRKCQTTISPSLPYLSPFGLPVQVALRSNMKSGQGVTQPNNSTRACQTPHW